MEILSPYFSNMNWLVEENRKSRKWTQEENKLFENALAIYDKETPDRWHKIASKIPGKRVEDVIRQYQELEVDVVNIEAGLIPVPGYNNCTSPSFALDWVNNSGDGCDGFKQVYGKKSSSSSVTSRPSDLERKKGVPWTEDEHKLFLMGLKKYGKGDWRNISRNFVVTRTPTQVASHAQKYFIRQLSGGGKDKRRASIHDITTVSLTDPRTPSADSTTRTPSPDDQSVVTHHPNYHWNQTNNGSTMNFNAPQGNMFMFHQPYIGTQSGQDYYHA